MIKSLDWKFKYATVVPMVCFLFGCNYHTSQTKVLSHLPAVECVLRCSLFCEHHCLSIALKLRKGLSPQWMVRKPSNAQSKGRGKKDSFHPFSPSGHPRPPGHPFALRGTSTALRGTPFALRGTPLNYLSIFRGKVLESPSRTPVFGVHRCETSPAVPVSQNDNDKSIHEMTHVLEDDILLMFQWCQPVILKQRHLSSQIDNHSNCL